MATCPKCGTKGLRKDPELRRFFCRRDGLILPLNEIKLRAEGLPFPTRTQSDV